MDLKEFDLDLPYIAVEDKIKFLMEEKNCTRNEASKLDYEENWKDKRRTFRLETRCMTAMFERILGKVKTDDSWKILIECVEDTKEQKVLNLSGVLTTQVKFDYKGFIAGDEYQKKQKTLCSLFNGIKIIAKVKGWNTETFRTAYLQIQNNDYSNEWIWKKPVKSPNNRFSAEVFCQHGVKSMDISIIFKDKKGKEIDRKKVISELPDEFAYARHLGELKWVSNSEITLVNKKGDSAINATLNWL